MCLLLLVIIMMIEFRMIKSKGNMGQVAKSQMPPSSCKWCWHSGLAFALDSFFTQHTEESFENIHPILPLFPSSSPLRPYWPCSCSLNTGDIPWLGASALAVPSAWALFLRYLHGFLLSPLPSSGLCSEPSAGRKLSSQPPSSLFYTACRFIFLHYHYKYLILYIYLFVCKPSQ